MDDSNILHHKQTPSRLIRNYRKIVLDNLRFGNPLYTTASMPSFLTSIYRADDLFSSLSTRTPTSPLLRSGYYRPWRNTALTRQDSGSTLNLDKDKFQIILDVQQFTPEEITVKTTDKYVVVEGKHEEKQDEHGFVSRHFTRRYMLPSMNLIRKNYKPSAIYQLFLYICLLPNRRSRPK